MVLVVLGALVIILGVLGGVASARSASGPIGVPSLPQRTIGGQLDPQDVVVRSGSCSIVDQRIEFIGGCGLEVAPVDSPLPWTDATRRAQLVVVAGTVRVDMTIRDTRVGDTLGTGESVRVVVTREGGPIALGCLSGVTACTVQLLEDPS